MSLRKWTKENILAGLIKFFDENGRYPTALEIDRFPYLPSSRQIQRSFGGLQQLRKELGFEIQNYNKGKYRSKVASDFNKRASEEERRFEKELVKQFGTYYVHVEKLLFDHFPDEYKYGNKSRADFYIYAENYTFCVDVFYAKDIHSWKGVLNIKLRKYSKISGIDIYLVNLNRGLVVSSEEISRYISVKKNIVPKNIKVLEEESFLKFIKSLKSL